MSGVRGAWGVVTEEVKKGNVSGLMVSLVGGLETAAVAV